MQPVIQYDIARTASDIQRILILQTQNLAAHITAEELHREGFVTVVHNAELLTRMNAPYPHIVARDAGEVVAYALVMLRSFGEEIVALREMFQRFKSLSYHGQALEDCRYFVMGQVCIAKGYRGTGIFTGLYQEMKHRMREHFDFVLTQVDETNPRSLRAHRKVGFEVIQIYLGKEGKRWHILLLGL